MRQNGAEINAEIAPALARCANFGSMASRSVNKVILVGRLGKDAETRFTPSGVSMSRFSLATSWRSKDPQTGEWKEQTDWHNIVVWRQENLAQYLTKGKQIYVEGRLQTRSYEDKDGQKKYSTEVVADELILLGGKSEGSGGDENWGEATERGPVSMPRSAQGSPAAAPAPAKAEPEFGAGGISDDDVPF